MTPFQFRTNVSGYVSVWVTFMITWVTLSLAPSAGVGDTKATVGGVVSTVKVLVPVWLEYPRVSLAQT